MKWGRSLFLFAFAASMLCADELHLRDGTVILGAYVGGTQKEVYFQHTPAGSDMYPLFMVESVKFNTVPSLTPGAWLPAPRQTPHVEPAVLRQQPASMREQLNARLKWIFALLFPPQLAAQFPHPAN